MCVWFLLCFASLLLFFFFVSNYLFAENYACQALIFSVLLLLFFSISVKFVMWLNSSERSNVNLFYYFASVSLLV